MIRLSSSQLLHNELMITKVKITMYICSHALILKEMLIFWLHINMNANTQLVMDSFRILFHDKIFP